jgi:hypothetical protein
MTQKQEESKGLFDFGTEAVKRAKPDDIIFIVYFIILAFLLFVFGTYVDKVHTTHVGYGIAFTLALFLCIILPGYILYTKIKRERVY